MLIYQKQLLRSTYALTGLIPGLCRGLLPTGLIPGLCRGLLPTGLISGLCRGLLPTGLIPGLCKGLLLTRLIPGLCRGLLPTGLIPGLCRDLLPTGLIPGLCRGLLPVSLMCGFFRAMVLAVLMIMPLTAISQSGDWPADSLLNAKLEEIYITAQRVPVLEGDLRRSVDIIQSNDIRLSAGPDLARLLSGIRGVDVRSRGGFGVQSDISIRGGTFDQTLVLLNGINVNDPQTGHHHLNVPVDLHSIEKIEVLRGPAARVFGPSAFNGVVHIVTREPDEPRFYGTFSRGHHRLISAGAAADFKSGPLSHHLAVSTQSSDGYIENTDFEIRNVFLRSQWKAEQARWDLQAGINTKAFGAHQFYTPVYPDQFEHTRTFFVSLRRMPEGAQRWYPAVYWRRHYDRFELFRHEAPAWYAGHNYHRTDVAGVSLNRVLTSSWGISSVGMDYRYEHIYSNVLGFLMDRPLKGVFDGALYTRSYDRYGISLMLEHSFQVGSCNFSAGTLILTGSGLQRPVAFFPGMDVGRDFSERLRWTASVNKTLRLPTFTDLFYSSPTHLGNPDLQPEEALSIETGWKYQPGSFQFDASAFGRRGYRMIDWVNRPGEGRWQSKNQTLVNLAGMETALTIPVTFIAESPNLLPQIKLQHLWIVSGKKSEGWVSAYVLDHLRHKVDLSFQLPFLQRWGWTATLSRIHRAGNYMLYEGGEYSSTRKYSPYWTGDSSIFYQGRSLRVYADAINVLDTHYVSIANVPQPGRWIRVGVEYSFYQRLF